MATTRIEIEKYIKRVRREAFGCQYCGRTLPQGLLLAGEGPTLTELTREPGMTLEGIEKVISERGWSCRTCLNKHRRSSDYGGGGGKDNLTPEELLEKHRAEYERLLSKLK